MLNIVLLDVLYLVLNIVEISRQQLQSTSDLWLSTSRYINEMVVNVNGRANCILRSLIARNAKLVVVLSLCMFDQ